MKTVIRNLNIAVLYALFTTLLLGGYFLLMKSLGLADNTTLRVFNFVILFGGVYKSISAFKDVIGTDFSYFRGLIMGLKTTLLTALFFTGSILVYYSFDPSFINGVLNQGGLSGAGSIFGVMGVILIEAIVSGFMSSFMCMQYLKNPNHVVARHSH
jgi:hypothetical protein